MHQWLRTCCARFHRGWRRWRCIPAGRASRPKFSPGVFNDDVNWHTNILHASARPLRLPGPRRQFSSRLPFAASRLRVSRFSHGEGEVGGRHFLRSGIPPRPLRRPQQWRCHRDRPYTRQHENLARITADRKSLGGRPCIRGIRVTVGTIVGLVASGHSREEILSLYPYLGPMTSPRRSHMRRGAPMSSRFRSLQERQGTQPRRISTRSTKQRSRQLSASTTTIVPVRRAATSRSTSAALAGTTTDCALTVVA